MNSSLHDEKTFYQAFIADLEKAKEEVIIESPYITKAGWKSFIQHLKDSSKEERGYTLLREIPESITMPLKDNLKTKYNVLNNLELLNNNCYPPFCTDTSRRK